MWLEICLKSPISEHRLTHNMLRSQKYGWNLHGKTFLMFHHHYEENSWKMPLLVISKILGLFLNTLPADDKYSFRNSENLPQPIQMQLSKKKHFLNFLLHFWNVHQILKDLKKRWPS